MVRAGALALEAEAKEDGPAALRE